MIQTLLILLSVLLGLLSLGLTLRLNHVNQAFADYRQWADQEIARVSRTDTLTGTLKNEAFTELLASECKRAVREFTPLTLMKLDVQKQDAAQLSAEELHQIAEILKQRLSRPGDQLGRCGDQQLCLLLPSTNEHAGVFAKACHDAVRAGVDPSCFQITLAACTFQPTASLSAQMAIEMINETMQNALVQTPGDVLFHAEYGHDFNPLYT